MPLIERTKESMRQEFVNRALAHEKSKSSLCKEYGISRPTGDKWIRQYQQGESLAVDADPLFLRKSLSRKESYF